jgi:hypothetical protein
MAPAKAQNSLRNPVVIAIDLYVPPSLGTPML